ncbi:MAG: hypothetical protein MI924_32955 [Chloroflexales bacterium]|nr:hypothetical protein [Chloroflexales bacterium]
MDWHKWHTAYGDSATLQARLCLVRIHIAHALEAVPNLAIRLISVCAGDGRDVIGTLINHQRRSHTTAYLIEIDSALVAQGAAALRRCGLISYVQFL